MAGSEKSPVMYKIKTNIEIISSVPTGSPICPDSIHVDIPQCSGFGVRFHPIHRRMQMHKGIDFGARYGTTVTSTSYGVVEKVGKKRTGYGNNILVKSGDYQVRYAHLKDIFVEVGDKVSVGDTLGTVGSSGTSTAPHLHYEVLKHDRPRDPIAYILAK